MTNFMTTRTDIYERGATCLTKMDFASKIHLSKINIALFLKVEFWIVSIIIKRKIISFIMCKRRSIKF